MWIQVPGTSKIIFGTDLLPCIFKTLYPTEYSVLVVYIVGTLYAFSLFLLYLNN
jgi:hypothetical protein